VKQRRLYQQLNYFSTHDQLTGLANRRLSDIHLAEAIEDADARGLRLGVVYIDVNKFKEVNDRFGHKVGDLYLQEIARRLGGMVRSADLLARIGGDEFLVTAVGLKSAEDAVYYKERLLTCFQEGFVLDGVTLRGLASAGLAVYPNHGSTAAELQRYADLEMYSAKESGRGALERVS
jgi:diguanylate cyclase (GGDEF)-like protein